MFITLEGCEGSGKSTLKERLAAELVRRGREVLETREPGGSPLGEEVRALLLGRSAEVRVDQRAELLLFLAARAQNVAQLIRPALSKGMIVLCDRFNDSSVAYQGVARGLGFDEVDALCRFACNDLQPDLTFYLDIEPSEGLRRAHKRTAGQFDRIEQETLSFHEAVRRGFREVAERNPKRVVTLDGTLSRDELFDQAWKRTQKWMT